MKNPYVLEVWVSPGVQMHVARRASFQEIVQEIKAARARWPKGAIAVGNADEADMGFNGLTEAENAALEGVI